MSASTDTPMRGFPPGTVVQYKDPCAEDRSYRVVCRWDQAAGTVDMKLSARMPYQPPATMETISTTKLKVIAYCDGDGNIEPA